MMSISPSSGQSPDTGHSSMTGPYPLPAWERTRDSQRPYFWPSFQFIPAEVFPRLVSFRVPSETDRLSGSCWPTSSVVLPL